MFDFVQNLQANIVLKNWTATVHFSNTTNKSHVIKLTFSHAKFTLLLATHVQD